MSNWFGGGSKLPYSELKSKIRNGEVKSVTIGESEIRATPKPKEGEQGQRGATEWVAGKGDTGEELEKLLDDKGIEYRYEPGGGWFSSILPWVLILGGSLLFWMWIIRRMRPGAGVMSIGKSKAKLVAESSGMIFADVAGVDEAVDELREIVDFLASPDRFRKLGGRIPKGV